MMEIIYVADDGKHFTTEWDCMNYENGKNFSDYSEYIQFFYRVDNSLVNVDSFEDIFDKLDSIIAVHVKDVEKAKKLFDFLYDETGYCYLRELSSIVITPDYYICRDEEQWTTLKALLDEYKFFESILNY